MIQEAAAAMSGGAKGEGGGESMSYAQKALIVMLALQEDQATELFKALSDREIRQLSAEIGRLRSLNVETINEALEDFIMEAAQQDGSIARGEQWLRAVIERAIGPTKAKLLLKNMAAHQKFEELASYDLKALVHIIRREHSQTQAVILAHIPQEKSAGILEQLPEDEQAEVIYRIATLDPVPPEVVMEIEETLSREVQAFGSQKTSEVGGVKPVVDILNMMDKSTEGRVLNEIEAIDSQLAEEIREKMFVFEDLLLLDDAAIQILLREIDSNTLVLALRTSQDDIRDKILNNMSKRAAQMIMDDLEDMGPVKMREVEAAQTAIVRAAMSLAESGQIEISFGGDGDAYV